MFLNRGNHPLKTFPSKSPRLSIITAAVIAIVQRQATRQPVRLSVRKSEFTAFQSQRHQYCDVRDDAERQNRRALAQ